MMRRVAGFMVALSGQVSLREGNPGPLAGSARTSLERRIKVQECDWANVAATIHLVEKSPSRTSALCDQLLKDSDKINS